MAVVGRRRMRMRTAENEGRLQQNSRRVPPSFAGKDQAAVINSEQIQRNALSRTAEPPPYYSCPPTYESPPVLVRDNSTVKLARSTPDSLCTLVRVTFAPSNDDEDGFTRQDQVGRNVLAPVGRSYHNFLGSEWRDRIGDRSSTIVPMVMLMTMTTGECYVRSHYLHWDPTRSLFC